MRSMHKATSKVENSAQVSSCLLKCFHAECHYAERPLIKQGILKGEVSLYH
jgi:hypothetical protein